VEKDVGVIKIFGEHRKSSSVSPILLPDGYTESFSSGCSLIGRLATWRLQSWSLQSGPTAAATEGLVVPLQCVRPVHYHLRASPLDEHATRCKATLFPITSLNITLCQPCSAAICTAALALSALIEQLDGRLFIPILNSLPL
jgi:hypothetical protein